MKQHLRGIVVKVAPKEEKQATHRVARDYPTRSVNRAKRWIPPNHIESNLLFAGNVNLFLKPAEMNEGLEQSVESRVGHAI